MFIVVILLLIFYLIRAQETLQKSKKEHDFLRIQYIETFANKLKNNARASDILARYGGDEFIAVYWGTNPKSLDIKLEELLHQLKNSPFSFEGNEIECSFSYGIVSYPQEAHSYNQLVKVADDRMYENKRAIKNK
ncbi:MAG: GGDEF domain-containing protein, partial [Clostridiaceae bacterium]|nr:GGDEF domain-containing protein [Clostridiaceae bacterium]